LKLEAFNLWLNFLFQLQVAWPVIPDPTGNDFPPPWQLLDQGSVSLGVTYLATVPKIAPDPRSIVFELTIPFQAQSPQ